MNSCVSAYGMRKLWAARDRGDWGEYVGRLTALVRLVDARPHSARFEWPLKQNSPRSELVRACLGWCRQKLMPDSDYMLAVRVLVTVALPQVRQIVVVVANKPTEHDVQCVLAECLAALQLRAFYRWEKRTAASGDTGIRLLEWAIRTKRFLGLDTGLEEGLQLLYRRPADTTLRQAHLREARKHFVKAQESSRVKQVDGLLLPNTDTDGKFDHSEVVPLSACAGAVLEQLKTRYHAPEHREYFADISQH